MQIAVRMGQNSGKESKNGASQPTRQSKEQQRKIA
jgi:hypothetical protein